MSGMRARMSDQARCGAPVVLIRPGWGALNLRELRAHRDLWTLRYLANRVAKIPFDWIRHCRAPGMLAYDNHEGWALVRGGAREAARRLDSWSA